MTFVRLFLIAVAALGAVPAAATTRERLEYDGYVVRLFTALEGSYNGCRPGKRYKMINEWEFVCGGFSPGFGFDLDMVILHSAKKNEFRFVIDDEDVEGALFFEGDEVSPE
jgi:hypothetical protein